MACRHSDRKGKPNVAWPRISLIHPGIATLREPAAFTVERYDLPRIDIQAIANNVQKSQVDTDFVSTLLMGVVADNRGSRILRCAPHKMLQRTMNHFI